MCERTIGQRIDTMLGNTMIRRGIACVLLLGLGMMAGGLIPPPPAAWGEVQVAPPPAAFKSGDQLSVPILQEIAATLNRIDGRLARMEVVFKELSTPQPRTTTNN